MNDQDHPDAAGAQAHGQPTRETKQTKPAGAAETEPRTAATSKPDPAATNREPVTHEASSDSTAAETTVLGMMPYAWWFFIGAGLEILFGGIFLGTPQTTKIGVHVSPAWLTLFYIALGSYVGVVGFGILRLERWAYYAAFLGAVGLGVVSIDDIVRWATGTAVTLEQVFFASLNALFFLYNVYFLLQPETRKLVCRKPFSGAPLISHGMALCGVVIVVPSLALAVFVNYIDNHIADATLLLIYVLTGVLMIVMAFCAVRLQRWVWVAGLLWAAILAGVSLYVLVDQLRHALESHGPSVNTQGLIASGIGLVVTFVAVYVLFLEDLRGAVFRARGKHALFSPPMLAGGLALGVFALVIYLLPGELGQVAIADTVFGLAVGAVVGSLPGADVANRFSAYYAGVLLAFASYVARGELLPYTKTSSAVVVLLMLVIVTAITAVIRSRAWFVLMLLGVATMYGLVEGKFQAAPELALPVAALALVGPLMGFGLGFTVSSLLAIDLVPYQPGRAVSSESAAGSPAPAGGSAGVSPQTRGRAEAA